MGFCLLFTAVSPSAWDSALSVCLLNVQMTELVTLLWTPSLSSKLSLNTFKGGELRFGMVTCLPFLSGMSS